MEEFHVDDGGTSPTVSRSMYVAELIDSWTPKEAELQPVAATTQKQLPPLPRTNPEDVDDVVSAARSNSWSETDVTDRCRVAKSFKRKLLDNKDPLLTLLQIETGKSRDDAYEEFLGAVNTTSFYSEKSPEYLSPDDHPQPIPMTDARTTYEPYGVAGLILPWNYPLALGVMDGLPALLAGNSLIAKPSERAPYTVLYMMSLLLEAGIPTDALHVVIGEGDVGESIVSKTDVVGFTGSTKVGRSVAETAAKQLTPVSLELGGKNPLLVLEGADARKAARGAIDSSFTNTGQFCMATERAFVHDSVYDDFINALEEEVEKLSVGVSYSHKTDVGVLVAPFQKERVENHVSDAIEKGATLVTGGSQLADTPTGYEPTVLTDIPDDAIGMTEETFGPVLYVQRVQSHEYAVKLANKSEYGLHASIWGSETVAKDIADEMECGSVAINDAFVTTFAAANAPIGGWKDSGVGRRSGVEGIRRYTRSRTVTSNSGPRLRRPKQLPARLYEKAMGALYKFVPFYRD